jgi:hypothetical protein
MATLLLFRPQYMAPPNELPSSPLSVSNKIILVDGQFKSKKNYKIFAFLFPPTLNAACPQMS